MHDRWDLGQGLGTVQLNTMQCGKAALVRDRTDIEYFEILKLDPSRVHILSVTPGVITLVATTEAVEPKHSGSSPYPIFPMVLRAGMTGRLGK